MERVIPGVNVVDNRFIMKTNSVESAVPLFIGFTQEKKDNLFSQVKSLSDYEKKFGGQNFGKAVLYDVIRHFFDNGGRDGYVFSLGSYDDLEGMTPNEIAELLKCEKLSHIINAEQCITLLAFPDCILIPEDRVGLWHDIWNNMLLLSKQRSGLFAVLDLPSDPNNVAKCLLNYNGTDRHHGGGWWPSLVTTYMKGMHKVIIPPSGAVIAAIQNNDDAQGVWSAPANIVLSEVIRPLYSWVDAHKLFDTGACTLNLIRSFPGKGTRIWGCRTFTCDTDSQYRYIQTRRFITWCEKNISQISRMFVFEPNNEITWYKLKGAVTNWLRRAWYQGGLYGSQENDAFQILLGLGESMNERDVHEGRLIMVVKLAVLYPAEFINLTINLNMNTAETV